MRRRSVLVLLAVAAACGRGPPPGSPAAYALELQRLRIDHFALSDDFRIMTAGQLTEEQLERMPYFGYDKVIALRHAAEDGTGWEEAFAKRNSVDFVRIPIGDGDMTRANAERLDAEIGTQGCVTVYCSSSNRVGGLLALRAHFVQGKSPAEALSVGRHHGMTSTEPEVRRAMGLPE